MLTGIIIVVTLFLLAFLQAGVFGDQSLTDEGTAAAALWNGYFMDLFVNNHTPAQGDAFGAYTLPTYTGYAQKTLSGATIGAISGAAIPINVPQQTFAVTGTGGTDQAYGYVISDGGGTFIAAEKFPLGPYNMQTSGDTLKVTLTETLTLV